MVPLFIAVGSGLLFLLAYHTYGRWLGRKIFRLSATAVCPSVRLEDGDDYVPTSKAVVFGHHFTSIAGTGPIVGPAIAVMWGWLPALLWVLLGSIFIGAVHDLGSLVVSLRNDGQTVGDIAGRVIAPRVRILFLCVLFLALTIVLAVFGLVIANVFDLYPQSIVPCLVQIPIAVGIGVWLHRRGVNLLVPSLLALALMYLSVIYGDWGPLHFVNHYLGGEQGVAGDGLPLYVWTLFLLGYAYVASVIPVWALLQPRDFINSLQLLSALGLIVVGLATAAFIGGAPPVEGASRPPLAMAAPAVNLHPVGAPPIAPFLFITVACGAISGFHCLVSSGTSSKQLKSEADARFVGYGAMVTEGFLAVLVILACAAGLGLGVRPELKPFGSGTVNPTTGKMSEDAARFIEATRAFNFVEPTQGLSLMLVSDGEYSSQIVFPSNSPEQSAIVHVNPRIATYLPSAGVWIGRSERIFPAPDISTLPPEYPVVYDELYRPTEVALTGATAWSTTYRSWQSSGGLASTVGAFVTGASNFVAAVGVPRGVAVALMGVLVASFAGTTMDTACRLQRYVVQELAGTLWNGRPARILSSTPSAGEFAEESAEESGRDARSTINKHLATLIAVVSAAALAAVPSPGQPWSLAGAGKGGMILWPLFGATNQLLGGLAFLVILFHLRRRSVATWFLVGPMLLMLVMPAWAMLYDLPAWIAGRRWVLAGISLATLGLEAWMVVEAALVYRKVRGVPEPTAGEEAGLRGFEVVLSD